MSFKRRFSEYERGVIVGMRMAGSSFAAIGDAVGFSEATVRQVFHPRNSMRQKMGRKPKLNARDIRHMVISVKRN